MTGPFATGSELRMKLGGFQHFRLLERLPGSRKAQDSAKRRKDVGRWMTKALGRFGRELTFGGLILGSLCAVTGLER